jgi:hypothetical protein
MSRYLNPIKRLGAVIVVMIAFGLLCPVITQGVVDEATRSGVVFQAIPFVAFFIAVLLAFILLIVLAALRFNGKLPPRAYRPIETVIILGILGGVISLFQPFHFSAYKYGFVMLLGATLSFILWSHIVPASSKAEVAITPLKPLHHLLGAVAGVLVIVALVSSAAAVNVPREPYGIRERVWRSYSAERQQEIATTAVADFYNVELPYLVLANLLPGLLVYFVVRELAAGLTTREAAVPVQAVSSGA